MTISQANFDSTTSVSIGSTIMQARQASGYSLDDLAITCGLTIAELEAIEKGTDIDPARVQRVAAALKIPSLTA